MRSQRAQPLKSISGPCKGLRSWGFDMRFNNFWSYRSILLSGGFLKSVLNSRRNLVAAGDDRPLPAGPYMAELDVTYRCDLRCRMCQRWLDPRRDELTLDHPRAAGGGGVLRRATRGAVRFAPLRIARVGVHRLWSLVHATVIPDARSSDDTCAGARADAWRA